MLDDERKEMMVEILGEQRTEELLALDMAKRLRIAQYLADSVSDENSKFTVAMWPR